MTKLLSEDLDENYDRFLEEAIATGCVWGLESDDGWALCSTNNLSNSAELDVMPLWSQPEYAQVHVEGEWSAYRVVPIDLEELLEDWLPGMHEDVTLVGPNWNGDLDGDEVEPLDLLEDFDELLS